MHDFMVQLDTASGNTTGYSAVGLRLKHVGLYCCNSDKRHIKIIQNVRRKWNPWFMDILNVIFFIWF